MIHKKEKIKTFICPCCKKSVSSVKMKRVLQHNAFRPKQSEAQRLSLLSEDRIKWACDTCIDNKHALISKNKGVTLDRECLGLVYFDLKLHCLSCMEYFVFSKKEQAFWFEAMGFPNPPSSCKECRQSRRSNREKHKEEKKELSTILADKDNLNAVNLKRVIEIYELFGLEEKARLYKSKLAKLKEEKA